MNTTRFETGVTLQGVDTPDRFVELAQIVEELGYDRLWLTDSSLVARYVYVYLALAAIHTKLKIGTAVTNPLTRHPGLTANAAATLAELSGGRLALGIGVGDRPLLEVGFEPATRSVVRQTIDAIRDLAAGEEVTRTTGMYTLDHAKLHVAPGTTIPVYISASGPKMLQLAGEIADGVIVLAGLFPEGIQFALENIAAGIERAGRSLGDIDITFFAYGSLSDDADEAVNETRSIAAWFAQTAPRYCELLGMSPALIQRIQEQYSGSEFHQAREAASIVPREAVQQLGLAGTVEDCRAKLQMLEGQGVRHVSVFPLGADRERVIRLFAEAVKSMPAPGVIRGG